MSTWRVRRHYGFGAARIAIAPEPHRAGRASLRAGLAAIGEELTDGGPRASLRRIGGELPALALGLLIVAAFVATLTRDHSDSAIEVVLLPSSPPPTPVDERLPEPVRPAPPEPQVEEPLVEVAAPKPPPPAPEPRAVPAPPPPETPPRLAARPEPPPPPLPRRSPPPSKPAARPRPPAMPKVARVAPPPPAPSPDRAARPSRAPARAGIPSKPRPAIDLAAASTAVASPAPPRPQTRVDRPVRRPTPSARPAVRPSAPSAPAAPAVEVPEEAAPRRGFRVASSSPGPGSRPRTLPGIAPPAPAVPAAPAPERSNAPARPVVRRRERPSVPSGARRAPRPAAAPLSAPSLPEATPAVRGGRVARVAVAGPGSDLAAEDRPGLAGVPLGELAACLSDREEDRLKQAVVAAVTTQKECASSAGTYRFVETRNLNAFLMRIERAPGRPVEDRCGELRHALRCLEDLESAGVRASR